MDDVSATSPGTDAAQPNPTNGTATAAGLAASNGNRVFASPIARRLALEAGLRLDEIEGTGPGGRIRRRDVDLAVRRQTAQPVPAAATAPAPAAPALAATGGFTDVPHSKFRRAVAAALTSSKQQAPHFYLKAACRVDALLELRRRANAEGDAKITVNDMVVAAAARAMVAVPDMNVVWTPDAVRRFDSVDIAVAVASDRGLLTPVVRAVQSRSLSDVSASIKDLAARANAGTLKQHELEGGSLTVSNLGMFGIEEFAAIINPPQVGILAVGAATARPVQSPDGGVEFGTFVTVVLSVDHRPVDGAMAATWLRAFTELVESPFRLLL